MPQLDPTWFASQFFWLCISFFAFYFVVSKFLAPRIAQILRLRQNKIDSYLEKAQDFKDRAESSLKAYEKALGEARSKADEKISKQKIELEKIIEEKNQEVLDKLSAELKKTEASVLKIKNEGLLQAENLAKTLSAEIIKKLEI